jgi:hypothetical protein
MNATQNHQILSNIKEKPNKYIVVNYLNGVVTSIRASSEFRALAKGRKYFGHSFVTSIYLR